MRKKLSALPVMLRIEHRDEPDGFYLDTFADAKPHDSIRFDSMEERQQAHDDLIRMVRGGGFKDDKKPATKGKT